MPKTREIDSTEKLLNLIRGRGKKDGTKKIPSARPVGENKLKKNSWKPSRLFVRRLPVVGVEIGPKHLRLAKIAPSDTQSRLLDIRTIPIPDKLNRQSPDYPAFIGQCLKDFCGPAKGVEIWSQISSLNVEVWHMRVPKVKPSQLSNTVYWSARKEKNLDEKKDVFDFELQGEVMDKGVAKYSVMAYTFPRKEVQDLAALFSAAGYPAKGITIASFAIQSMFRTGWLAGAPQTSANLFIGRNWSRIDIIDAGSLTLTRGVLTGTNSFIESLMTSFNDNLRENAGPGGLTPASAPDSTIFSRHADLAGEAPMPGPDLTPASGLTLEPQAAMHLAPPVPEPEHEVMPEIDFDSGSLGLEAAALELPLDSFVQETPPPVEPQLPDRDADSDPFGHFAATLEPTGQPELTLNTEIVLEDGLKPEQGPSRPKELTIDEAGKCFFCRMNEDGPKPGDPMGALSDEEIFEMTSNAVDRLVRQIERTFEHYTVTLGSTRVERLYVSGLLGTFKPLMRYLETQLGMPPAVIDPLAEGTPGLGTIIPPANISERLAFAPAIGLALSANRTTPNFLYTYADRERDENAAAVNQAVLAGFLALTLAGLAFFGWQRYDLAQHQDRLADLKAKFSAQAVMVDRDYILNELTRLSGAGTRLRASANRYTALGVINEVAVLTPEHIRLSNLSLDLSSAQAQDRPPAASNSTTPAKPAEKPPVSQAVLEGVVLGDKDSLQTDLFAYIYQFKKSPILTNPVLQSQKDETMADGKPALRFTLTLDLK